MILLTFAFGLTALIYSLAGFAGGSTYIALLTLAGISYKILPFIGLLCNTLVSALTGMRYIHAGLMRPRLLIPHMALAIPCAYLGGRMEISKWQFQWLTAISLSFAALYLLKQHKRYDETLATAPPPLSIALPAGAVLGFVSGVIGIGGGIFLSPLLFMLRAGNAKEIAATSTLFILVNSLAGMVGQFQKLGLPHELTIFWPLPLAVLVGGIVGSHLTLRMLSLRDIAVATGAILLFIALNLWWQIAQQ